MKFPAINFPALVILVAAVIFAGCKRSEKTTESAPAPTPAPAPIVSQSANHPSPILLIDGESYAFPPITIRLRDTGGAVNALLRAGSSEGDDNALYFDLTLDDIDSPADIAAAEWHFRADENSDRADSLNGIFLRGGAVVLQPADARIDFGLDGTQLRATISGEFFQYDDPDSVKPSKSVNVRGRVAVERRPDIAP